MGFNSSNGSASAIQGQLLRLNARREVAIYLRGNRLWVADFIDGRGELVDARIWFRFNCASVSATHARRRMVLESAIHVSAELVERVECLHRLIAVEEASYRSSN